MPKIKVNRLYTMVGADFSQQEPKLTADLSNDEKFIKECAEGKDAYGTVASLAFNKPYEECLEFYLDENGNKTDKINKEGKERRTQAKSILLGICYGRTIKTIADQLGCTEEKAQQIYNSVFTGIKGLKTLTEESEEMARQLGYVETKWGRRRHLPNMQLAPYEIEFNGTKHFDPFFDSKELGVLDDGERLRLQYLDKLNKADDRNKKWIKLNAEKDGFKVKDNTKKIDDAKRQCVNCVDDKTEILTKDGWKTVYDLSLDDIVYTYNLDYGVAEWNNLKAINKYKGDFDVYNIQHPSFNAVCTSEHKWIIKKNKKNNDIMFKSTEQLAHCGDDQEAFPILRTGNINTVDGNYEDWFLKLIGWFLTNGSIGQYNGICIYQSRKVHPKKCEHIENILQEGNIIHSVTDRDGYITWEIVCEVGLKIKTMFPNRVLTPEFIYSLSTRQAQLVIDNMLLGGGTRDKIIICDTKEKADMFEMLCAMAGIACCCKDVDNIGKQITDSKLNNIITIKNKYYNVRLLKRNKIHIYKRHITKDKINFVWCPTTNNGTWYARRNGETYFTGNSRIQGGAADQTKQAMRLVSNDLDLKNLDFHMVLLVHDEIIGECPIVNITKAEPIFVQRMLDSAKDLRTGAKCDATCVLAWYDDQFGNEIHPEELTKEKILDIIKEAKYIWD